MKADFTFGDWTLAQDESLTIDPATATLNNPTVDGYVTKTNTGATYGRDDTGDNLMTGPSATSGGSTRRFFVEWDVSGIPDGATITDTVFKFQCRYDRNFRVSGIFEMDERPSTQGNDATLYNHIDTLTQYVAYNGFVPPSGINKVQDLGAAADADLEAALSVNWFAIGARMENEVYDGVHRYEYLASEEYGGVTPPPTLYVVYTAPPVTYKVEGVTRNSVGVILGSCIVWLFLSSDKSYIGTVTSNAVTGAYSFTALGVAGPYFLRSHKDGAPNVFGTTDDDIDGVEE